jgi:hypothetical protein
MPISSMRVCGVTSTKERCCQKQWIASANGASYIHCAMILPRTYGKTRTPDAWKGSPPQDGFTLPPSV